MRDLLLGIIIPAGLVFGLFSAPASILILNWISFQRPHDFSWGAWNTLPVFQIALFIAIFSNIIRRQFRFNFTPVLLIYLAFLSSLTISTIFAYDSARAWNMYNRFLPPMWVTPIVIFATIHNLKLLKWVFWVSAGGLGFNAFKVGLSLTASGGGHLTSQISGFVGDNNVFGLVLCLVIAVLLGLRRDIPNFKAIRISYIIFISFIFLCIVYTKSRGALLSVVVIFFLAGVLSGKPFRSVLLLVTAGSLAYLIIPPEYFDRLDTLQDINADESAMGRLENWNLAWKAALNYPFFGVGPDNHIPYNRFLHPDIQIRVAHSIYFQVIGELGFIGFSLYLAFIISGLWILFKTWRFMVTISLDYPDFIWARDLSFWMVCGYIGYLFGSAFLNMLYIEYPWYFIFYGSLIRTLVAKEISDQKQIA